MLSERIKDTVIGSIKNGTGVGAPYQHWILKGIFPTEVAHDLAHLPMSVPDLGGVSGKRELHNKTRNYFDTENNAKMPVCQAVSDAFQDKAVVGAFASATGTELDGTYLRIEYAQDTDGFWLEPHTDLGVKKLTFLCYLSDGPGHRELGTDIYADAATHVGRTPADPNSAMLFIPSSNTWHGFEKRTIHGIRKTLIINYVTSEWRAKEQLAFADKPVSAH